MKIVLGVLGAFALVVYIFPVDGNEVATKKQLDFLDFPVELKLDILEHLGFEDLIRTSKTHPVIQNVIEAIFQSILKRHRFRIIFEFFHEKIQIGYDSTVVASVAYEEANENFDIMLEFFQYFGHCIIKLDYRYDSPVHNLCEAVHKQIKEYVADSVSEIDFYLDDESISGPLNDLIAPYRNCKVAKLRSGAIEAETLNQMFPMVRSLDLMSIEVNESLSHFPFLESLGLPQLWVDNKSHYPLIEKTLELNPQLKHLSIQRSDQWDFLAALNQIRPELESLHIGILNLNDPENVTEPLRFANMKVFKYTELADAKTPVDIIPFEFGSLEEIELHCLRNVSRWIDIMAQNEKLRRFTARNMLRRETLKQIADELPNLEEFTMEYHVYDSPIVQDVVDYLQTASQLKKAVFLEFGKDECDEAAEQLNEHWKNVENNSEVCCFVRQ